VFVRGQQVKLSATEYELLVYLFQNADRVLTPAQISETVWGSEHQNTSKYIHTYVWRLRRKLEKDLKNPGNLAVKAKRLPGSVCKGFSFFISQNLETIWSRGILKT
jgi:DNA-binding response OmpR family regulator